MSGLFPQLDTGSLCRLSQRPILAAERETSPLRELQVCCVINGKLVDVGQLRQSGERQCRSFVVDASTKSCQPTECDPALVLSQLSPSDENRGKRMERYGLALHPEKTRLVAFARPPASQGDGKGLDTFDFLGFSFYWGRSRRGRWMMCGKTRRASLRRAFLSVAEWCRRHRHLPVRAQHAALRRRLVGHFNYFGVNGKHRSLVRLVRVTERVWYKWLRRRGQRRPLSWQRFGGLLERYPLPEPRIVVRIWVAS